MPVISTEQATTSFSSFLANFSASFLKYFHLTFFYTITTIFKTGELVILTIHVENLKHEQAIHTSMKRETLRIP